MPTEDEEEDADKKLLLLLRKSLAFAEMEPLEELADGLDFLFVGFSSSVVAP